MAKKAADTEKTEQKQAEYRVLARKYRPQNFAELKGQDALVRTLTNAIESGRIAHAFMLTGVRGVGKTTTARIIARALNCEKGPTVNPCGQCDQCCAIAEDRHVDVIEMDAASHTGVDDVREIIESVQYAPISGRYKIFIIDEVHMLSKNAFNALLKTLEEPPEHTKFVFATTDIRRVPVTVLSRCQRFDLRRIDAEVLKNYFIEILGKEGVAAEEEAVALIARAADGSARDGLSLLDQAISREPQKITEEQVRIMLGLVDRTITLDLYEALMKGAGAEVMALLDNLHKGGAAPSMILQDLMDLTHFLTKVKVSPDAARDQALPEAERVRGTSMAMSLPMPALARTWQMLLKGVAEVTHAQDAQQALEMVLIRLLYVSDQPTPGDVLKQLKDGSTVSAGAQVSPSGGLPRGTTVMRSGGSAVLQTTAEAEPMAVSQVASFQEVVALFGAKREVLLQSALMAEVHLVKFDQGHIEMRLRDNAPRNLVGQVSEKLSLWTGRPWIISLSRAEGQPTLREVQLGARDALMNEVRQSPIVSEVLKIFPGATVTEIKE